MIQEINLSGVRALRYTPDNLKADAKLPCMVICNGMGENANDGPIELVYRHGPMYYLKDGGFKPEGVVIIDLFPAMDFPSPTFLSNCLGAIRTTQPVDAANIFVLGISAGGESWFKFLISSKANRNQVRGAFIMSITDNPCTQYLTNQTLAQNIYDLPIWFFHGTLDMVPHSFASARKVYDDLVLRGNKTAFFTPMEKVGHSGWETVCSPAYKSPITGINIYQWLFAYVVEKTPVTPPAPKLINTITVQVYDNGSTVFKEQKAVAEQPKLYNILSKALHEDSYEREKLYYGNSGIPDHSMPSDKLDFNNSNEGTGDIDDLRVTLVDSDSETSSQHQGDVEVIRTGTFERYNPKPAEESLRSFLGGVISKAMNVDEPKRDPNY